MTTVFKHDLWGCAPAPFAHYLKALGILRLVAEQADPQVRGAWRDEHFVLWSVLDGPALERFFLEQWAPTPLLSPWNKGSGLMGADPAVAALERSVAERFAPWRRGIAQVRALNKDIAAADAEIRAVKAGPKKIKDPKARAAARESADFKQAEAAASKQFAQLKAALVPSCRAVFRGRHEDWLDAAVVLTEDNESKFPAILGTGGNDGRLDMTNNAMQRLGDLFDLADRDAKPKPDAERALQAALWGTAAPVLVSAAVGQFLPGAAGGANSTNAAQGEPCVNRWDFLLALEGAVAFRAGAARKLSAQTKSLASAPFAVASHAAGYGSAGLADEGSRGEQWLPLWDRPASAAEVTALLAEGRAQTGRTAAKRPIDLVRAMSRLGVARGLTSFARYGYIERNGQSNLAVCLGRLAVGDAPQARLVDEFAPWLETVRRNARGKGASASLRNCEKVLTDRVFAACARPESAGSWQAVLLAAADAEALDGPGAPAVVPEIPALSPAWLAACDDGSAEFRLALALGSAAADWTSTGRAIDPVREHFVPTERGRLRTTGGADRPTVEASPRVVVRGRTAVDDLGAVVARRLTEATVGASRRLQLVAARGCGARLQDIALFLAGQTDDDRIVRLARAFSAVRRPAYRGGAAAGAPPPPAWLALRVAHAPAKIGDVETPPVNPAIVRRLLAGDAASATALVASRLRGVGLRPAVYCATCSPLAARRWAAALAFPLCPSAWQAAITAVTPFSSEVSHGR